MQSQRLQRIGAYLFADLDRKQEELQARGTDVISLSTGDPDIPTPTHIIEALMEGASDPRTHRYPPYRGTAEFRRAAAAWFEQRFGVALDPDREVLALIGSKEGLAHLPWATMDPGDVALVPDPGYPVYRSATIMAEGDPFMLPLAADRGFLPDLEAVPEPVLRRARLLFLNYPNNPTGATADLAFFARAVEFARRWNLLLVHDNAYSEVAYDGYRPPSVLQVPGAKEVAIELLSLSKPYNMTGWRIGFAVGRAEAIAALGTLKTNVDSGIFGAIQRAGVAALAGPQEVIAQTLAVYRARRDRIVAGLRVVGWNPPTPKATLYIWMPTPNGTSSVQFAAEVLERTGVLITPGVGYGPSGEGYVRLSLTTPDDRIDEALARIRRAYG
ncbi:MAG: LL-diaminopimelate aminotransferase [Armatimonadota bacterium]|nr:LL-diaminopimelate aminotransferase [Armatimonadota bacterium]MDR7519948.1 LL-diaminopimelate aminotransferase [Armatimonadota bacterium]MDR7548413.1 LL-diaminopimelate aminotransferase [Armatimonadota bacterium]